MTKQEQILQHLRLVGHISSWEAFSLFNVTRLSDVIYKFRNRDVFIVSIMEGQESGYVRYYLFEVLSQENRRMVYKKLCEQIEHMTPGHDRTEAEAWKMNIEVNYGVE